MGSNPIPLLEVVEQLPGAAEIIEELGSTVKLELEKVHLQLNSESDFNLEVKDDWSYEKLIECCREFLVKQRGGDDVLSRGYRVAKDNLVGSSTYTTSTSFSNLVIRSHPWQKLHSLVGNKFMCDIFLNYSGFVQDESCFVQIFGVRAFEFAKRRPKRLLSFNLSSSFYKNSSEARCLNPIPSSKKQLIQRIFSEELEKAPSFKRFESKIRLFSKLANRLLHNHSKFPYFNCFEHVFGRDNVSANTASFELLKTDVAKFCAEVFDAVFPAELYGCAHNKHLILKNVSYLINRQKGTTLYIFDLMKQMKLKSVTWLGRRYEGKWNKQDHDKRKGLFESFLNWLFSNFFPRLLASFFHITHASSSKEILFFSHSSWEKITQCFIQEYESQNLIPVSHRSECTSFDCQFRVMPKRNNDFRVINVPLLGKTQNAKKEYSEYIKKEVRPTRQILNKIRLLKHSKFPKVSSLSQIPIFVGNFRETLYDKFGTIPPLYFLKFDVKECYDNLPIQKITDCLSDLLTQGETFFLNTHSRLDLTTASSRKTKSLMTADQVNREQYQGLSRRCIHFEDGHTVSLSEREILTIAYSQLSNTYTTLKNKTFRREKGVFQGLHLSSLFCDLVYDKFVEEYFEHLQIPDSILLRLADDFLIISTDRNAIQRSQRLVDNGVPEYGIQVNKLKSFLNFSSSNGNEQLSDVVTFCGLEISTVDLSLLKRYDELSSFNMRSQKKLIQKLLWMLKIRVSNNILSLKVNQPNAVLNQVFILISSLVKDYINGTAMVGVDCSQFALLLDDTISEIHSRVDSTSKDGPFLSEITNVILTCFLLNFQTQNSRFRYMIEVLEKRINSK